MNRGIKSRTFLSAFFIRRLKKYNIVILTSFLTEHAKAKRQPKDKITAGIILKIWLI
jgi:hypothetical protein